MANKIICSNSITFPKIEDQFPSVAECRVDLSNGILTYGEVTVPTIPNAVVKYTGTTAAAYSSGASVMSEDDVNGQTLRFPFTGTTVTFVVESDCDDIVITVQIPTEAQCIIPVEITDPCSCDTKVTVGDLDYFLETFTISVPDACDGSTLELIDLASQFPVLDPVTQQVVTTLDVNSFTQSGSDYSLSLLINGIANASFQVICTEPGGETKTDIYVYTTRCTFTCDCDDFTALITSEFPICTFNDTLDLRYNLQNVPNSSYRIDVFDTTGNLLTAFTPTNLVGVFTVPGINPSSGTDVTLSTVVTLIDVNTAGECPNTVAQSVTTHVITEADCTDCGQDIGCGLSCLGSSTVVCDPLSCPPGHIGSFTGQRTCRTVNLDTNGNQCSVGPDFLSGEDITINCSNCPACERWDATAGPNGTGGCVLDTGSTCSSTFGPCPGSCNLNTCLCTTQPVVCTDSSACNAGASGPCVYCNCSNCLNQGPSGVCGNVSYTCPNGGTVTDCSQCIGFPELVGCGCTDSACAGFTGCDQYDNDPCITCTCNNGVAQLVDNNGANCPCGTCLNGSCTGSQVTDIRGNTCCTQDATIVNGQPCCNPNVCQGITTCQDCQQTNCPTDVPVGGSCSGSDYEIVVGPVSVPSDCNCTLTVSGAVTDSVSNYDGSILTYTVTNPTTGQQVTTNINCN